MMGEGNKTEMHRERSSKREANMWSQTYNEAGSTREKRQRPERMKRKTRNCNGRKIKSKKKECRGGKTESKSSRQRVKKMQEMFFPLPFISP